MAEVIQDVACTVCGCVCDDITLHVNDGRIAHVERGCTLSESWLAQQSTAEEEVVARVDGKPVEFDEAVMAAARVIRSSRSPLVYGLSTSSTAGQRAACRLADRIGATIDTTASTSYTMAMQSSGVSTSTLGEVRHRSDTIVYWGSNPLVSHPRHVERFVESPGMFVPQGRAGRQLMVVDVKRTETAEVADRFVQVNPGGDFDLIWALRAVVQGIAIHENSIAGVPAADVIELAAKLSSANYGAVFFGSGLAKHGVPQANVEALLRLVTDLNAHTRFVAQYMDNSRNATGADKVLCWQTGFPINVNLSRGYPRYNPVEYSANELLEQREVDAAVLVGSEGVSKLSAAAFHRLQEIPVVLLDSSGVIEELSPTVQFTTATCGIHRAGTAYRMDGVPIPLRSILESKLASDDEVLSAIETAITEN